VLALRDQKEDAFATLRQAVELGFRDVTRLYQEQAFGAMRRDERFAGLVTECQTRPALDIGVPAQPADIKDGIALIADSNAAYDQATAHFRPLFNSVPPIAPDTKWTATPDAGNELLQQWWSEGTAAGNQGDFYDNRDGGHSKLPRADFPQLTFIEYGPEAQVLQLQWGLPQGILQSGVVIGNASVAAVGDENWRSMPRAAVSTFY
jgi:hypothetical protein